MMKTLIILIHPNMKDSVINKRWIQELEKHPDKYVIHDLYARYPDEKIDISEEQNRLMEYDKIVFQFPFYWFNCPPLFKKWLDEVLTYGWAYGSKSGYQLADKKMALALSVGIKEEEYLPNKKYKYTVEELTRPFELTFEYIKADYKPLFAFYGIETNTSFEWIESSVSPYLEFIDSL